MPKHKLKDGYKFIHCPICKSKKRIRRKLNVKGYDINPSWIGMV